MVAAQLLLFVVMLFEVTILRDKKLGRPKSEKSLEI